MRAASRPCATSGSGWCTACWTAAWPAAARCAALSSGRRVGDGISAAVWGGRSPGGWRQRSPRAICSSSKIWFGGPTWRPVRCPCTNICAVTCAVGRAVGPRQGLAILQEQPRAPGERDRGHWEGNPCALAVPCQATRGVAVATQTATQPPTSCLPCPHNLLRRTRLSKTT